MNKFITIVAICIAYAIWFGLEPSQAQRYSSSFASRYRSPRNWSPYNRLSSNSRSSLTQPALNRRWIPASSSRSLPNYSQPSRFVNRAYSNANMRHTNYYNRNPFARLRVPSTNASLFRAVAPMLNSTSAANATSTVPFNVTVDAARSADSMATMESNLTRGSESQPSNSTLMSSTPMPLPSSSTMIPSQPDPAAESVATSAAPSTSVTTSMAPLAAPEAATSAATAAPEAAPSAASAAPEAVPSVASAAPEAAPIAATAATPSEALTSTVTPSSNNLSAMVLGNANEGAFENEMSSSSVAP